MSWIKPIWDLPPASSSPTHLPEPFPSPQPAPAPAWVTLCAGAVAAGVPPEGTACLQGMCTTSLRCQSLPGVPPDVPVPSLWGQRGSVWSCPTSEHWDAAWERSRPVAPLPGHRERAQAARRKLGSITGPLCIAAPWLWGVLRIPPSRATLQGAGDSVCSGKQRTKASCEGQGAAAPAAGPGAPEAPPSLWHQNNLPDHGAPPSFPFLADTSRQKPGCASWERHLGYSEGGANPSVSSWCEPLCQGSAKQLPPPTGK